MGNPQERLIWLAGFIDGEGYLGIKREARVRGRSRCQLLPRVVITNTSNAALEAIVSLLSELSINCAIRFPKAEKAYYKPQFQLEISYMKPVLKLLSLVRPHLVVKAAQADVLIEFCRNRIREYNSPYSAQDFADWQRLKELNQNPQRLHARVLKEAQDIVRAAVKAAEVGRNVQPLLFGAEQQHEASTPC